HLLLGAFHTKMAYDEQKTQYQAAAGSFILGFGQGLFDMWMQVNAAVLRFTLGFLAELGKQLGLKANWDPVTVDLKTGFNNLGRAMAEWVIEQTRTIKQQAGEIGRSMADGIVAGVREKTEGLKTAQGDA